MTNPQLTRSLLAVIRSLPDADRMWLLEQLGHDSGELSSDELAQEPDLYSFSDGEPIVAG
jgi:hypothetical protein